MTLEKGFEPHLAIDNVAITGRDIEMLRAIAETGSMSGAADDLGRSYPHLQRRVVELEGAVGSLTTRVRGGSGGGGTELTTAARNLIRQFDRLRVELAGVTTVTESVIRGTVIERHGELATVETEAGDLKARVPAEATDVEIAIRSDAVVLVAPGSESGAHTSLRNQLVGTVSRIDAGDRIVTVRVDISESVTIESVITTESLSRLGLKEGSDVVAAFKSTAARATPSSL
ncbi:MAG: molybdate transport system regulatory protein [Natronomonas sp.]|jgi:molybdate transport system regulatory protein|uniref:TOBE domain-containing protein n=1 Tax=Natronomonas sp. TaxID=2184060 RepID=UPI00398A4F09